MRIVTWNCNGALRKKHEALDDLGADIFVVQECEDPAQSTKKFSEWADNYLWVGRSKNKGIGVFAKKGVTLEKLKWPDDNLQQFLPCRINDEFNLLAVWTMNSPAFQYIGQFWKYLQLNKERIADPNTVICGDFNSNVCWDKKNRNWNHCDVVRELESLDVHSMYHVLSRESQGEESKPTLFMQRKKEKPYHIDYAFAPRSMMDGGSLEVGHPDRWLEFSDHMPVVFNLSLDRSDITSDEARDLLRQRVWRILPKYEDQYELDSEESGSEYTNSSIMELFERGRFEGADRRKAVLLLRKIMVHDRMNSESGNFEFIDDHKDLLETIFKRLEVPD